jgi:sarcosine oxidase subunit alpha
MSEAAGPLPPGRFIAPDRRLTFTFDGRPIPAMAGQSIAAALYAAGVRVFTRSFKYHRPRGLFCVAGDCPNCLMQVDDRPNVRTCMEPAREGQVVRHQNAWPSLGSDVLGIFDKIDRLLPVGFYYKRFHKPRWIWPMFEYTVRRIAGLGRVDVHAVPRVEATIEHVHADVCVVGAGPAGLAAAAAAAEAGADVLLLERLPVAGGHLLYDEVERQADLEPLLARLAAHPRVHIRTNTTAFGLYEGNLLGAFQGDRFLKVRAAHIIVCTGSRERPFIFHNNDLPGIFLRRGVQRLARLHGVRAGSRAVVLTDRDDRARVAEDLQRLGIAIAAVVDPRPVVNPGESQNWPVWTSSVVLKAQGRGALRSVTVARVNADGSVAANTHQEVECDLLCLAGAPVPANELLLQAGTRGQAGVSGAGAAVGTFDLDRQLAEGGLRGAEVAAALGYAVGNLDELRQAWQTNAGALGTLPSKSILPAADIGHRKRFICLCEDVTEKDLYQAVQEGFEHIETLKRYSTATMGPCQGKVCGAGMAEVCALATRREIGAVGATTSRPPAVPVELAVLAAGRHHPVRRTPLHSWHQAAGARWLDAGQWQRPESYGDPLAEVRAVRGGVGLIDVSTLGKLEVIGPDAVELLERIYLNKWADLKVGRARYGVACNEDGILFDDGVGTRLGPERFYLTATTGNADAMVQWLELWRATWRLRATVLNQTSARAAMNLAGPQARQVLARLTTLDVSAAAFPYMAVREAKVAGVACRLLRIGFVGELGYEIHCDACRAWHLWEALAEGGSQFGLRPFGVEAQRILRLEKGHLIIGQDTDALSTPLEAGLDWLVRFDKPQFHGRTPLVRLKERGPRSRLVGFLMRSHTQVPAEGCQIVEHGRPVGRVTSVRFSPTLQRSLGLAWVPASRSAVGASFVIRSDGADAPATVAALPFYDPEGQRLKS